MIVDAPARVAIVRSEPGATRSVDALAGSAAPRVSAVDVVAAAIVADAAGDPVAVRRFDRFVETSGLSTVAVAPAQAALARAAYRDLGKEGGHPTRPDSGDCFACALAVETGEPLLLEGDDFGHTDANAGAARIGVGPGPARPDGAG
ncbi:PIN domain-containing protein [Geodermatophilus sp. DF01_2]|uniref:PIN domain-containing protein n=1 Tax=Geodermatophilus sp. DF01-2 TaxID=2559610 RepID=UPI001ADDC422|nr:PIN domain-containing protein [Geodermatophilus sp. DF01_2]